MKKNIVLLALMFMTFLPLNAAITSLREARIIMKYLGVIKQHDTALFSDPLVIQSVLELADFCENYQQVTNEKNLELTEKLKEFVPLLPADYSGEPLAGKANPLSVNGQTLVAYWSQLFSSTYLLFDITGNNTVALSAPLILNDSYSLQFPTSEGSALQVLGTTGGNPAQLAWITTITNTSQLNLLTTATSCDKVNTLILRDNTGSFIATTITLTGNSLINYSTNTCSTGSGFVWAPTNQNTIIGLFAGNSNNLTGTSNIAIGYQALANANTSNNFSNIAIGYNALSGANILGDNIAIGSNALSSPSYNQAQLIAIGSGSLQNNTTGYNNVGMGYQTLNLNTTGTHNIAIGYQALKSNVSGFENIAIGYQSLFANLSSQGCIGLGWQSAFSNISGTDNIAIGPQAYHSGTTGGFNTAIGAGALFNNLTSNFNAVIGYTAGLNITGAQNTCIGTGAGYGSGATNGITSGGSNIAIGYGSGNTIGTGSNNIVINTLGTSQAGANTSNAITIGFGTTASSGGCWIDGIYNLTPPGIDSLVVINSSGQLGTASSAFLTTLTTATNCDISNTLVLRDNTGSFVATTITLTGNSLINYGTSACSTGSGFVWAPTNQNTIIGLNAGNSLAGSANTAIGYYALSGNTTGTSNIAIGSQALQNNIIGTDNVAIGVAALQKATGSPNIAIGSGTLQANTTGIHNKAIGYHALQSNLTGTSNIAIGYNSQTKNQTGNHNTALGYQTLESNVSSSDNIAIGYSALQTFDAAIGQNVAIGSSAFQALNTTNAQGVAIGYQAGQSATGTSNVIIGASAATGLTSGGSSVVIGASAGAGTTVSDNVVVGAGSGNQTLTGATNVIVGQGSGTALTSGTNNTIIGQAAGNGLTSAGSTVLVGQNAEGGTTPSNNVVVGAGSGNPTLTGASNVIVGQGSGTALTSAADNVIIGARMGNSLTTGDGNIYIGNASAGAVESHTIRIGDNYSTVSGDAFCYIGGIYAARTATGTNSTPIRVYTNVTNQLAVEASSERYKTNIMPMAEASSDIYRLNPVSFTYLPGIDPTQTTYYGLIAEEVYPIYPSLVPLDENGLPFTVNYDMVAPLHLNEHLKLNTFVPITLNYTTTDNLILGKNALQSLTTGSGNIIVGPSAGNTITTGYGNTLLGLGADVAFGDIVNATALGAGAFASSSNTMVLGNSNLAAVVPGSNFTTLGAPGQSWGAIHTAAIVSSGSFSSNTITLTGNPLVEYFDGVNTYPFVSVPGIGNTFVGVNSGVNIESGSDNTVLGWQAGTNIITGTNNIYLGYLVTGTYDESNVIRIGTPGTQTALYAAGISGLQTAGGSGVFINSNGLLGTAVSSKRYKENIQDMATSTDDLYKLRPVTFNYSADNSKQLTYGLIAEEVQEYFEDIVTYDADGNAQSVQYHLLPAMLLNECKKDHARITFLEDKIAKLEQQIMLLIKNNESLVKLAPFDCAQGERPLVVSET